MSLQQLAQTVQDQGRGPDTMLVHMAPSEVAGLQQLAQAYGGSLTVNPQTGLPEAGFLESILPAVVGGALAFVSGGTLIPILAGAATGLATQQRGESTFGALARGALGGFGGSALGSGLAGAAGAGSAATAGTGAASAALAPTAGLTQAQMLAAQTAGMGIVDTAIPLAASVGTGVTPALTGLTQAEMLSAQTAGMGLGQSEMLAAQTAGMGLTQAEMLAAQTAGMGPTQAEMLAAQTAGMGPEQPGVMDKISSWWDKQSTKDKMNILSTGMKMAMPEEEPVQLARGPSVPSPGYSVNAYSPSGGGPGGSVGRPVSPGKLEAPGSVRAAPVQQRQMAFAGQGGFGAFPGRGFAEGGLASLQSEAAIGDAGVVHLDDGGFVFSAPATAAVGGGSSGAGQRKLAEYGGIAINGPGDGQSDSIRALIGGQQPARVADGEVYFPPQAVAKIGGGDHQKGAKRLYEAMNRAAKMKWPTASEAS